MRVRVIGLGQAAAGDDGVGLAVLEQLRKHGLPDGVELAEACEDTALISLLQVPGLVVLIDAVLGTPPGEVVELTPEQLVGRTRRSVSTHGIGVCQAIELARVAWPAGRCDSVRIVAVTISRPERREQRLSPEVAAAVPLATAHVLAVVSGALHGCVRES